MRAQSIAVVLLLLGLAASPAAAQTVVTPESRMDLGITVYEGFAQVRDTRRVGAGVDGPIVWTGFPSALDPGTTVLRSDGRRVPVELQALEAGIASESSLLSGSVGRRVTLVSPEGIRRSATLVSADGPVFRVDGGLLVDWPGAVELPAPEGELSGEPRLRWELADALPADALTASYLTGGLGWSADYTGVLAADGETMALSGSVTVENGSGVSWPDATLQLVAGEVRRVGEGRIPRPSFAEARGMAAEAAPDLAREELGAVHLYTLDRPVTLGRNETTRAALFETVEVPVEAELILRGRAGWIAESHPEAAALHHPEVWISFDNAEAAGLGEPLPSGVVHAYREDDRGTLQFAGEAPIPHTPAGERIRLRIGSSFDVVAERRQIAFERLGDRSREVAWRIEVRNHDGRARIVKVYEPFPGEWTIVEESHSHERVDAETARWTLNVPADGETVLEYRVRIVR